ncbi:uncharacterized protein N7515_009020 [Penicillium bovifimosum]|uniref:Uncharacterized protein n=1 Tax=Penicillium bovifimosum TaxID=126998 RepID=A0A9W9KVA2_9EURO|nr:uncharacterized protein N7515_009020 [Penicillium bovifimosum]KAJ5121059.1 hypothetical protein N7515_009020 [Penicillium bovifimosum]
MALVRDPYFWKRFSTAVHLDEESKAAEPNTLKPDRTSWLSRQRQKSERSILYGFIIFFIVVFMVVAGVVIWWLAKNNWLRPRPATA